MGEAKKITPISRKHRGATHGVVHKVNTHYLSKERTRELPKRPYKSGASFLSSMT